MGWFGSHAGKISVEHRNRALDVAFDEDRARTRCDHGPENAPLLELADAIALHCESLQEDSRCGWNG